MRIPQLLMVCYFLLATHLGAKSSLSEEQIKLLNLSGALSRYLVKSKGEMPADLIPLRDYIDLPQLLRPETDPHGSFPHRYTFLPTEPWIELPGEAPWQLLVISVTPLPDGTRGAIWRYPTGDYSAGMIAEADVQARLKGIDLKNLKPMGGDVPAPTHPLPKAQTTEYQAKILQLVREGKVTPQPRGPAGKAPKGAGDAPPDPAEIVSPKGSLQPMAPSAATKDSRVPAEQRTTPVWPWAIGCLVFTVIALFAWKRRQ